MLKKYLLTLGTVSTALTLSSCSMLGFQNESTCESCQSTSITQQVIDCPKQVAVIHYQPTCTNCTLPVTVRSKKQTCHTP